MAGMEAQRRELSLKCFFGPALENFLHNSPEKWRLLMEMSWRKLVAETLTITLGDEKLQEFILDLYNGLTRILNFYHVRDNSFYTEAIRLSNGQTIRLLDCFLPRIEAVYQNLH